MAKTNDAERKPLTHFETVPLEVVKEIVAEDASTDYRIGAANHRVHRPDKKRLITVVPARSPARRP